MTTTSDQAIKSRETLIRELLKDTGVSEFTGIRKTFGEDYIFSEEESGITAAAKKAGKASKSKKEENDDDDDEEDTEDEEKDDWEKPEEEEEWDPDFDEFDIPDSKSKKGGTKKGGKEEEDLGLDDDFKDMDLFNDNDFDEEDDDY